MQIQIKTTNIELTPAIEEYIHQKIGSLEKFIGANYYKIFAEIGKTTQHHKSGDVFRAEINIDLPGKLIRSEAEEWDLRVAIDRVKDQLQQELKKYKEYQDTQYKRGARLAKVFSKISSLAWFRRERK